MIYDFDNKVESYFNLGLFSKDADNIAINHYLQNRLSDLCKDLGLVASNFKEVPFESIFTDMEFNKQVPDQNEESFINKHFYRKLFGELKKRKVTDETKAKDFWILEYKPKFCFTLDRSLAPDMTSSGIEYGALFLGSMPILFYLWIDIQEIIKILKKSDP